MRMKLLMEDVGGNYIAYFTAHEYFCYSNRVLTIGHFPIRPKIGCFHQCLGKKWADFIGHFSLLFHITATHNSFYVLWNHYLLLYIYPTSPKYPKYYHWTEGESEIQLCPPSYFPHIHPLPTLAKKKMFNRVSRKIHRYN